MSEPSIELLAERIEQVRTDIRSLARSLNEVSVALKAVPLMQRDVQAMQERQDDLEKQLAKLESSVNSILLELPGLKEVRRWVVVGVIAVLSVVGGAVLKTVILDPQHRSAAVATETK